MTTNTTKYRVPLASIALIAGLACTPYAFADAPLHFRTPIDLSFFEPDLSAFCGFPISVHVQGVDDTAVYFDKDGNLTKIIDTTPHATHTFVNDLTGTTYTSASPASVHISIEADGTILWTVNGLVGHIFGNDVHGVRAGHATWIAQFMPGAGIVPVGDPIFIAGPVDPPVPDLCEVLQ